LAEYAPGALPSNPNTEYIYLGGQLIASKSSGAYTFYVRDHLSVRQTLADANPNNPTELGHLPFGESWYGSGTKWRFTSYERDSTMGDDYAMMRRYQFTYGRFSSPDPIGGDPADPQTWNGYTYVANSPLTFIDPLGLFRGDPSCNSYYADCGNGGDGPSLGTCAYLCLWSPSGIREPGGSASGGSVRARAPNNRQPPTSASDWFKQMKQKITDDAKKKKNVCATGSLAFGGAALWLMENPAASAVGGAISLGLGAADYFGVCPYSF
jgi:RHS repeat-associated protein